MICAPANENARLAPGAGNTQTGLQADSTPTRARVKALIMSLACWGFISADLASWLIQRGGLRHE